MNYIGSKLSLKSFIKEKILEVSRLDKEDKVFGYLFAGTGVIGKMNLRRWVIRLYLMIYSIIVIF